MRLLSSAEILKYSKFDKEFEVLADANDFVIGRILIQDAHLLTYEIRKLTGSRLRWPTYENELCAVVHCLKSWRYEELETK